MSEDCMKLTPEQIESNLAAYRRAMETMSVDGIEVEIQGKMSPKLGGSFSAEKVYRIRPAKKLRPWKREEFPRDAWFRNIGDKEEFRCERMLDESGFFGAGFLNPEEMLGLLQHSTDGGRTWKPCGVEE